MPDGKNHLNGLEALYLPHRTLGDRIVQAARLAAALHLAADAAPGEVPNVRIGPGGPSIRQLSGPDRPLAA